MAEDGSTKDELGGVSGFVQENANPKGTELPKVAPFTRDYAPSLQKEFGADKVRTHPNQLPVVEATSNDINNSISAGIVPENADEAYKEKVRANIAEAHPGVPTEREDILKVEVGNLGGKVETDSPVPADMIPNDRPNLNNTESQGKIMGGYVEKQPPVVLTDRDKLDRRAYRRSHGTLSGWKPKGLKA